MKVLLLAILFLIGQAYFEQKIIRRAFDYDPDLQKIDIDKYEFPECPKSLLKLHHNDTNVTQICFTKDLFYNVEVILGDKTPMELSLDLTSPWTWFKSNDCRRCKQLTSTFSCKSQKKSASSDCSNDQFDATFDSQNWQDDTKTAKIYSDGELAVGTFQSDVINFLAYNSSQRLSIGEYIAEKLGKKEKLDKVSISELRMLNVDQIYGMHRYLADGALGLGFGYAETDEEDVEPDTDFLEKLIKQQTSLKLTRQRFSIYCLETGPYFPDYVVQFGGFDSKYAHKHSQDIQWLKRVPNSGYYWMVELQKLQFTRLNLVRDPFIMNITKSKAILTLSSQSIELPLEELKYFLKMMNSLSNNAECSLVDEDDLIVYCTNLHFPTHFVDLRLELFFDGAVVDLSSHLLYKNCTASSKNGNLQNCLLNVRYSKSDYVILGEPFMKWHYTIFDNEPGNNGMQQIGLLPAATNMYYQEHIEPVFNPANWTLYKFVVYTFVFGIILVCCVANCRKILKDLFRAFRRAPHQNDQVKLRVKQLDDELNQDVDEDFKEQALRQEQEKKEQWEKQQNQFQFSMKFDQGIKTNFQSIEDNSI